MYFRSDGSQFGSPYRHRSRLIMGNTLLRSSSEFETLRDFRSCGICGVALGTRFARRRSRFNRVNHSGRTSSTPRSRILARLTSGANSEIAQCRSYFFVKFSCTIIQNCNKEANGSIGQNMKKPLLQGCYHGGESGMPFAFNSQRHFGKS